VTDSAAMGDEDLLSALVDSPARTRRFYKRETQKALGLSELPLQLLAGLALLGESEVEPLRTRLQLSSGSASRILGELHDKDLVDVRTAEHDARRRRYRLTAKGRRLAAKLVEVAAEQMEDSEDATSVGDRDRRS
jgi:DNA-binding MarR family transcriptional regulator